MKRRATAMWTRRCAVFTGLYTQGTKAKPVARTIRAMPPHPSSFLHRPRLRHCTAACLLALATLGSHAATALPDTPPLPSSWSQASSATPDSLAQWWDKFNDAQLSALVTQALQANPSLHKAEAALQQAQALRDAKQGALRPA